MSEPKAEEVTAALEILRAGSLPTEKPKESPMPLTVPPADVPSLLARLEAWLQEHRPRYARGLKPGADPAKLDWLDSQVSVPLPGELRALLAWHDGQSLDFVGAFQQSFFLLSVDQIAMARQEMLADTANGWQVNWLPFLGDDRDNYLFLDMNWSGHPVRVCWQGNLEQPVVAPSLQVWLEDFVTAVEHGDYVEDPERGDFLRRT